MSDLHDRLGTCEHHQSLVLGECIRCKYERRIAELEAKIASCALCSAPPISEEDDALVERYLRRR